MPLYAGLSTLSQTAASNAADGSADAPSTIDQQTNLLASYIAQLRDGNGFTTGASNFGQCRLTKSGANLLLSRYNGLGLTINGVTYAIPSAGVTLAPTSLTPSTLYYIYAYMNAGVMTLEAVTTGHSADTASGMEIKTGDATRTLVGMAQVATGPAWQDTATNRYVLSWFNRRELQGVVPIASDVSTPSLSLVEVEVTWRPAFLAWNGDVVKFKANGAFTANIASTVLTALRSNGGCLPTGLTDAYTAGTVTAASFQLPFSVASELSATSDGAGTISLYGSTGAGTATWKGGASAGSRSNISVVVQG